MFRILKRGKAFYATLFTLALPIALQNLINQSLAITDTAMLGIVGESELAAVTMANSPLFVLLFIMVGFQSGLSILISQYWGKGDLKSINRVMGIGFYICAIIALIASITVVTIPTQIVSLWTNNDKLIILAAKYMRVVGFSYFINSFTLIYVASQRSMENVKFGLFVQMVAMLVNTGLNYIFIFGNFGAPRMGVEGAALGTLVARIVELIIVVIHARYNDFFRIQWHALLRPGKAIAHDFIKYSMPVVMNETLWGLGNSIYPAIFGRMGEAAIASYTIAGNIDRMVLVLVFGFGSAAAVMIGKEIGRGNEKEACNIGIAILIISAICGIFSGGIVIVSRSLVFFIFNLSEQTCVLAGKMLLIVAIAMPFRAMFYTSIVGILRGGGDVRMAFAIDILPMYLIGIPLAFFIAFIFYLPPQYVYGAMAFEEIAKNILTTKRIFSRKWVRNITRTID